MLAWHFLQSDKRLQYGDGREVKLGETLTVDETRMIPCKYGLHASVKALDALNYVNWSGVVACRVELGGRVVEDIEKHVASERTVVAWCSADRVLQEFALRVAEDVLLLFEAKSPNDKRPRQAIEVKRKWLRGEATDKELAVWAEAAWAEAAWAEAAWDKYNAWLEEMLLTEMGRSE
jgi:hypothetical protein